MDTILSITSCHNDHFFVTGHLSGKVTVYDISDYCVKDSVVISEAPPEIASWRAHDGAVVSVKTAMVGSELLLITASSDKTARLWTVSQGHLVGTFGQRKKWNLEKRKTWSYPL